MNIEMLYEMQKELDARIIREKGLEGQDLLPNTVLALQVEIGELANEWRGFKHWSNDREPRRERMLEEYVDCLHFFLSIARQLGMEAHEIALGPHGGLADTTVELFVDLIGTVSLLPIYSTNEFNEAFELFMQIGKRLGFTFEQIASAYAEKNRVNHDRQENGY